VRLPVVIAERIGRSDFLYVRTATFGRENVDENRRRRRTSVITDRCFRNEPARVLRTRHTSANSSPSNLLRADRTTRQSSINRTCPAHPPAVHRSHALAREKQNPTFTLVYYAISISLCISLLIPVSRRTRAMFDSVCVCVYTSRPLSYYPTGVRNAGDYNNKIEARIGWADLAANREIDSPRVSFSAPVRRFSFRKRNYLFPAVS